MKVINGILATVFIVLFVFRFPIESARVMLGVMGIIFLLSPLYSMFFNVPWILWQTAVEKSDFDNEKSKFSYPKIFLFSVFEIRQVPANFEWVVRSGFKSDIYSNPPAGYYIKKEGWRCIFLPELLRITVKMVDLRAKNIDFPRMVVNTKANPVLINTQATYKTSDSLRYSVILSENPKDVIKEMLSAVLNMVTAEYDDQQLVELNKRDLKNIEKEANVLINIPENIIYKKAPKTLHCFGIDAVIRIQNIIPVQRVLNAMVARTVAKIGKQAAESRKDTIAALRQGAGLPDGHIGNIAIPLMEAFFGNLDKRREGVKFPKFTIKADLGGTDPKKQST